MGKWKNSHSAQEESRLSNKMVKTGKMANFLFKVFSKLERTARGGRKLVGD